MKNISKQLAAVVLMFLSTTILAEGTIPAFYLYYAEVQYNLKNDKGRFDELMELSKLNSEAADVIAAFWYQRSVKNCGSVIDSAMNDIASTITTETSKQELQKIQKEVKKKVDSFLGLEPSLDVLAEEAGLIKIKSVKDEAGYIEAKAMAKRLQKEGRTLIEKGAMGIKSFFTTINKNIKVEDKSSGRSLVYTEVDVFSF